MTRLFLLLLSLVTGAVAALVAVVGTQQGPAPVITPAREAAYGANNVGVARLEQFEFPGAIEAFRRALMSDPSLALARLNLGIALFYAGDTANAARELVAARPSLAGYPQADYVLGLIARATNDEDEAIASFTRVQAFDANDAGTLINLGQLLRQQRREQEALTMFRRALAAEPYNATAAYGLAQALLRIDNLAEGEAAMARFERLRESGFAVTYSQTYLEQGRYAEALSSTGAEAGLVDVRVPEVVFQDQTASALPATPGSGAAAGQSSGSVMLADLDTDGDLDLVDSGPSGLRVLLNTGGRFTHEAGALPAVVASAPAVATLIGDYDNDGAPDLVVLRPSGLALLRQATKLVFADITAGTGLTEGLPASPRSAAWLDSDHDADLDLLVVSTDGPAAGLRLWQNNGNGRFVDVTTAAGLSVTRPLASVIPTDFDNRRDVDVLLVGAQGNPFLFRNLREGAFRDVAADVGLSVSGDMAMAASGDVNKDGFVDLFFAQPTGPGMLALSDGRGRFTMIVAPAAASGARAAQFADYDADGLLDLITLSTSGPRVIRNLGQSWSDVTTVAWPSLGAASLAPATSMAAGDTDGDGRVDIVVRGAGGVSVWRSRGGSSRTVGVRLTARVSNRTAAGTKIDMRAGSLKQRLETYAATPAPAPADLVFGLGARARVDVVRVLWPSGILQAEALDATTRVLVSIEELDRRPSSCPYLFTWSGERFEFMTDFMGGGEMGHWEGPGLFASPDPDEYVRIDGSKLRAKNGRYEIRITNELEESLFLDRAELVAVSHPGSIEVHPNEGLASPTRAFTIYTTQDPKPPIAAVDDNGRDVLDSIRRLDRRYADTFRLESVRGYAADHTLTLMLPAPGPSGRRLLLLTGWTDYAYSKDNVAAAQAGLVMRLPSLEARDAFGTWHTAIPSIGLPVGRPQTIVVDLSEKVPASVREVRIRTTARVYWDQIRVDTSDGRAPVATERLQALSADLSWRGFSAETSPDGYEPFGYDFSRPGPRSPWKLLPGRYTRLGDVRPLVLATDDMFVVSRPGDAIALAFDANALAPLPAGWTRTFLLYADGFSKEMDLRSASPDVLDPMPFHAMTRYPYASAESYPQTPAHVEYRRHYNTRVVPRALPPLELSAPDRRGRVAR